MTQNHSADVSSAQREPYVPTTYQQDKLAQLTDLIDVFTRKVWEACPLIWTKLPRKLTTCSDQVAQEEHQVEALHLQIRQCQDQVIALPHSRHSMLL